MSGALDGAVELLERGLAYTRGTLADVDQAALGRDTPCDGWPLGRLLAHMEDALDAFIEAAAGRVAVEPVAPSEDRVHALREKACALLGAWTAESRGRVSVGDTDLAAPVLVATAALEITVHGWDVGQATGRGTAIPGDLAAGLLGVAEHVIDPADRGRRFAPARTTAPGQDPGVRLLGYLGRDAAPSPTRSAAGGVQA